MKLFARGLNFFGQLGIKNGKQNLNHFEEVISLSGKQIRQLDTQFTQSLALLNDGQIVHWGYVLDSLTTTRTLSYYKKAPKFCQIWQKYSFLGKTLGLRLGYEQPNLLNENIVLKFKPLKISMGGGFVLCLCENGEVFGIGENYKGQLGQGDAKYKHIFSNIIFDSKEKIIDIQAGFQHSLFLTASGYLYGCGRSNWHQVTPIFKPTENQQKPFIDFYNTPLRMVIQNEKISKISTGFHHSIFLTLSGKIFALGFNNHGQCGTSNLQRTSVDFFQEVFTNLDQDEKIIEIAAGKSHNVFITNKGNIYSFGATIYNQLARKPDFDMDSCSPSQVHIEMEKNEYPVKVKAKFDRSAVFTNLGNCYVWGGENQQKICGENHSEIVNLKKEIGLQNIKIADVGLGYMHTLVLIEDKNKTNN